MRFATVRDGFQSGKFLSWHGWWVDTIGWGKGRRGGENNLGSRNNQDSMTRAELFVGNF